MSKVLHFPAERQEETYGSVLRGILEQQFQANTWGKLQTNPQLQLRARILIHRLLSHLDPSQQMRHLMEALPLARGTARRVAKEILKRKVARF